MSKTSGNSGKPLSRGSLLILAALLISLWIIVVYSSHLPHLPYSLVDNKSSDVAVNRVEGLLWQTKQLVEVVVGANLTLSHKLRKQLSHMRSESPVSHVVELKQKIRELEQALGQKQEGKQRKALPLSGLSAGEGPSSASSNSDANHNANVNADASLKWLVVGIPSVARLHNEDYLLQTLESFAAQLPTDPADLLYHQVLVHVISFQVNNNKERQHIVYDKAKEKYTHSGHPLRGYFQFTELTEREVLPDPVHHANEHNDQGDANHPGYLVRRQTRNIATTMRKSLDMGRHYLFLEDDMQLCPHALLSVQYLLHKASLYHPNWLAIRASYGMNGIFMRNEDLRPFMQYLVEQQKRRPPDHLVVEYYAGETPSAKQIKGDRVNIGFKYNLFNHLGVVSTLRSQRMVGFPTCYELLTEPTVFKVEAFSPGECPRDDIWPCNVPHPNRLLVDWGQFAFRK